ncbi:MAG: PIN domain-containing protein [Burkholderiales bacterium]
MRPLRLALDTNVWLDWLVFDDPLIQPLKAAVAAGRAGIVIDDPCEDELIRVLAYPVRKVVPEVPVQAARLAECRRITSGFRIQEAGFSGTSPGLAPLPVCSDPDDQKFLELARNADADCLVTKDKALLVLARHKRLPPPFRILTPAQIAALPALYEDLRAL